MNKLLLIDGHYLLFKMFYGIPPKIYNQKGQLINAVVGFVGALLNYIRTFNPTHIFIAFDSENNTYRKDIYYEYKANRENDFGEESLEDNPFVQLIMIKKILDQISVKHYEVDLYEADDVIASYSKLYDTVEMQKIIISADKDLLQVINDNNNVFVYVDRGKNSVMYNEAEFIKKYAFTPKYIIDYLCFIGDKVDNISGIPGIGHVTATKLIQQMGDIESIIEGTNSIMPIRVQKKVVEGKNILVRNKKLIKLKDDLQVPFLLEELSIDINCFVYEKTMQLINKCI